MKCSENDKYLNQSTHNEALVICPRVRLHIFFIQFLLELRKWQHLGADRCLEFQGELRLTFFFLFSAVDGSSCKCAEGRSPRSTFRLFYRKMFMAYHRQPALPGLLVAGRR